MDLLILAAGMGSRFGGLKQIEPIDKYGNFIIDYSIYDAIKAGFNRVVFVIKEDLFEEFRNTIGKRIEGKIDVKYVFQKIDDIPLKGKNLCNRKKPWGTAHAIMSARKEISGGFLVINSDDFYGRESFELAYDFLKQKENTTINEYANIAYEVKNTLTENGKVKRGVCIIENNNLLEIIESEIEQNKELKAMPLDKNRNSFIVEGNQLVSMNMFAFTKDIFKFLKEEFVNFYNRSDHEKGENEFLTADVVSSLIKQNKIKVNVIKTSATWQGVTYNKDKSKVESEINKLVEKGEYKKGLWY